MGNADSLHSRITGRTMAPESDEISREEACPKDERIGADSLRGRLLDRCSDPRSATDGSLDNDQKPGRMDVVQVLSQERGLPGLRWRG